MAKRVLVVDDEKLIVKGIRFSLEQDGMEVDCAYDGEEALSYARDHVYDMILLDIMLPKLDGFEVCQQIREFSDVPIVMLTAKGDDMDKILGKSKDQGDYAADRQEGKGHKRYEDDCQGRSETGLREQKSILKRPGDQPDGKRV